MGVLMTTYRIVRFYQRADEDREVVRTGLTQEEAKAHCLDPETTSKTCTHRTGLERTKLHGDWFEGFEEE